MKFNEQATVENYIIKFLKEKLGYEYIKPEVFSGFRDFENEYLIKPLIIEAVKRINYVDDTVADSVYREIKKIDTNEGFLNLMRYGVNMKAGNEKKKKDYFIVDFKNIENNQFVVTNQFYFEGDTENIRPDIYIFLNGLPVVDIEAKSPTASLTVNYENGVDQIKRYERVARKMFLPNCFNISTDGLNTVYGSTYSPKQYFNHWREEGQRSDEKELENTLMALLSPERLLDVIKNFIVFEKEKEQTIKKIARYQQIRATNKIVERVVDGSKKRGLIWHTQGSGKSLTMFFSAWKLRFDENLKNPKVFILVDRIDLDDQIYDTFINCGGQNVVRIESRKDLEKKIKSPERGIFISTIQKFSELGDVKNLDENIIVLSDEAHRDNEGVSAINLRDTMKNAFFFGFTGTPIDKVTLNTHRNFGEEGERYLDYYSIQEAIDDGATLPVTYEARLSKFFIDEDKLDQQFDELTKDLDDKQKQELTKKYGKKEAVVKLEKRMEAIARDVIEHYKLYVEPNGFKAQVVCYDREATAKYKDYFDKLAPKEWTAVVYSPGDRNSDEDDLKKYNTNKQEREKIIANFKDTNHPLKFLLVCDMLLTGFDAPIEQVMYLDKPLRDHNLLQAIARTNRVYPNKGCGKIIDYYGITKNLYDALNFDESVVDSAMIDLEIMKKDFIKVLEDIMDIFVNVNIEDPSIDNLRRCLKIFIDNQDKQVYFSNKYSKLKLLFEILSPDPFLKEYLRKFEWITSFYLAFAKEFRISDNDMALLSEYGEKVKKIIQNEIDYEGITKNFRELKVNDLYTLERLDKMDDEEKALNLEKMLKQEISTNIDDNPIFKKFSERLSAIRNEFEKNQIDLAERIKRYYNLLNDIKSKSEEAKELGMNLKEYGLFVVSGEYIENDNQKEIIEFIKEMTKRLENVLDKDWQESSKREQFIKEIKKVLQVIILIDYKNKIRVNDFNKYLNRLVDVIIKKF
ncbi:MAG: HsdR family type I site-specific deoxyribonuclease [Candidatus Pacebacteria bacterium]|nr:HsdR family type I site-specific deoxyribonuclease [Candidatus Paceibacterota bacterium]